MHRVLPYLFALVFIFQGMSGQDKESPFELQGYLSNMQSVMFEDVREQWIVDNLFHNRLNFFWYGGEHFTGTLQLRSRLMYGQTLSHLPGYSDGLEKDPGWVDLSFNLFSGNSVVMNSIFDRAWIQYSYGSFVVTAGRQRINWGQTFVWNVNDIFNAYSYFDFDYEERPGSDALRVQYYPNYTSTLEIAAKVDSADNLTAAALVRFNLHSYDVQILAGVLQGSDYVGGLGWSGNIRGAGFRGEACYFHPLDDPGDNSGMLMFSAGLEYLFTNSLMLQGEYLYSSNPLISLSGFQDFNIGQLSVKQLAFTRHTLFVSGSYPVTPLFNASLAGMYFPELKGYFFGPSLSYNVSDNVDLGFFLQYFNAESRDPVNGNLFRQQISLLFLRLKWNF